jgi:hypothetical protein
VVARRAGLRAGLRAVLLALDAEAVSDVLRESGVVEVPDALPVWNVPEPWDALVA